MTLDAIVFHLTIFLNFVTDEFINEWRRDEVNKKQ
jgi:hypothetical protein